ncbi:MAG: alpha/beta fold hydrolase [Cyanobacteria bacterium P01_G01_bin.19]
MEEQATGDQNYRFNYVFIGDQNKPIVLFLHGFMGCWQDFQEIADLLQPAFCCLLVDLPGHGKTEVSSDRYYQMPEVAMAIVNLLKQLSIPRCFLIGYSMGGRLALYLAVFFSEYFIKVVL